LGNAITDQSSKYFDPESDDVPRVDSFSGNFYCANQCFDNFAIAGDIPRNGTTLKSYKRRSAWSGPRQPIGADSARGPADVEPTAVEQLEKLYAKIFGFPRERFGT